MFSPQSSSPKQKASVQTTPPLTPTKSFEEIRLVTLAAMTGDAKAQMHLGTLLQTDSKDEAKSWESLASQKTKTTPSGTAALDAYKTANNFYKSAESLKKESEKKASLSSIDKLKIHINLAHAWYWHAATLGHPDAICIVADNCAKNIYGVNEEKNSEEWFQKAKKISREITDPRALYAFAKRLHEGYSTPSSFSAKQEAIKLYYLAVAAGNDAALAEVRNIVMNDLLVESKISAKDRVASLTLLEQATASVLLRPFIIQAAQSSSYKIYPQTSSIISLLNAMEEAITAQEVDADIIKNSYVSGLKLLSGGYPELALIRFEKAAIAFGDAEAAYEAGKCCRMLPSRMEDTFQWFQLAAVAGHPEAQNELFSFYTVEYPKLTGMLRERALKDDTLSKQVLFDYAMEKLKTDRAQALLGFDRVCEAFSTNFNPALTHKTSFDKTLMLEAAIKCLEIYLAEENPQHLSLARGYYQVAYSIISTSSSKLSSSLDGLHHQLCQKETKFLNQQKEEAKIECEYLRRAKFAINPLTPIGPAIQWDSYYKALMALFSKRRYGAQALFSDAVLRNPTTSADYAVTGMKGVASLANVPIASGLLNGVAVATEMKIDAMEREEATLLNDFFETMAAQDRELNFELDFLTRLAVKLTWLQKENLATKKPQELAQEDYDAIIKCIITEAKKKLTIDQLCSKAIKKDVPLTKDLIRNLSLSPKAEEKKAKASDEKKVERKDEITPIKALSTSHENEPIEEKKHTSRIQAPLKETKRNPAGLVKCSPCRFFSEGDIAASAKIPQSHLLSKSVSAEEENDDWEMVETPRPNN